MAHYIVAWEIPKTADRETSKAAEKFREVRADPRSYLHFVTHDVVEYILRPMATAITLQVYRSQTKSRIPYVNGQKHGVERAWYENGHLMMEHTFVDGKRHGRWRWFFPDGRPNLEANYVNGELLGPWRMWDPDGRLVEDQLYTAR